MSEAADALEALQVEVAGLRGLENAWRQHDIALEAAGPIRNQRMIDEGKPDVVMALPGGRGTADMIRRAEAAGIRVIRFTAPDIEE